MNSVDLKAELEQASSSKARLERELELLKARYNRIVSYIILPTIRTLIWKHVSRYFNMPFVCTEKGEELKVTFGDQSTLDVEANGFRQAGKFRVSRNLEEPITQINDRFTFARGGTLLDLCKFCSLVQLLIPCNPAFSRYFKMYRFVVETRLNEPAFMKRCWMCHVVVQMSFRATLLPKFVRNQINWSV